MPIKNYTTKVEVFTTVGEIQSNLARHGARKIMLDYGDDGHIESVSFAINTANGMRGIKLPARADKVFAVLRKQKVNCDESQAERVAWRIVKSWVDAQMALLETEMVDMDEIFLPYMINDAGKTLFEVYQENQLLLENGG